MKTNKKKKKEKKGFTLVELLVAITILGIILAIAIPQVLNLQNDNKTTKYDKYAESLISSGKLYTDSYAKDMFGNNTSGCYDIPYSELKSKNLAKDIKIDGANCNTYAADGKTPLTYVKVLKSNENYSYQVAIKCVDKNGKTLYEKTIPGEGICDGTKMDEEGPGVTITPDSHDWYNGKKSGNPDKVTVKVSDLYGLAENTKIQYAWQKAGTAESSLAFKTKDFKNKRGEGTTTNPLTTTIEVPQGVTGEYTLIIKTNEVRDANGIYMTQTTVKSNIFKLDNTKPVITSKSNSKDGVWTEENVEIKASATDNHSGINKIYYTYENSNVNGLKNDWSSKINSGNNLSVTKTWSSEMNKTVYIVAEDKAGNRSTPVSVGKIQIDKSKPTCTVSGGSTTWTKSNRKITVKCNDGGSGCKQSTITETISTTTKTKTYTVEDKSGKTGTCTADVYVDKTAPECGTVTNSSTTWRNTKQTITQACTDSDSGCEKASYSTEYLNNKTSGVYIYDKVGNYRYCSYNVYVDTVAPYSPWVDPVKPYATITDGTATAYVKSGNCSRNVKESYETNKCTVDVYFKCHDGGSDGLCWVTYGAGEYWTYAGVSGNKYWEYRSYKYGDGCPNGLYVDWNQNGYGSKDSACKYDKTINEMRAVDNAGNVGGTLQITYNFSK